MNESYEYEMRRDHKRANKDGYVYKHILVAEKMLGRELTDEECVHHKDGNRKNNSQDNLMIFRSNSDHVSFHKGAQCIEINGVWQREGQPNHKKAHKKVCKYCGVLFNGTKKQKYCCMQCFNYDSRKVLRPNMEELLEEIRRTSLEAVGRKYGVTGNAVKKWIA